MAKKKRKNIKKGVKGKRKTARANKKLITIVTVAFIVIAGVLGGLFYVNLRSAEKNIQNANEFYAIGDYKKAYKLYGRAVSKEPNNLDYVAKVKDTLNNIVPVTSEEASAFYDSYLSALVHESRYSPLDIESHLAVADELYKAAHLSGSVNYWRRLKEAAENGYDRVSSDNPRRHELLLYIGLASLRIENASMTEDYDAIGNIRFPGEDEIEAVIELDPDNAVAWATLAFGRMAIFYRINEEGQTKQAVKNRKFADDTMKKATEKAGESFDVLATSFRELGLQKTRLFFEQIADNQPATQEALDALEIELLAAQEKLLQSFNPELHGIRTSEIVGLLVKATESGVEASERLLVMHLEKNPKDFGRHYLYANVLNQLEKYDEAEAVAKSIVESPQQTVSLEAIEQFYLRPVAAQFLVELTATQALNSEDDIERNAFIDEAKEYREVLADLVSNNIANQGLVYSNGIIALAEKRYSEASASLEEVISKNSGSSAQRYRQTAIALAEIGSTGLAIERLKSAMEIEPSNLLNYLMKARLEIQISDFRSAKTTLGTLTLKAREIPEVIELLDVIAMRDPEAAGSMYSDPILELIVTSERASAIGEYEDAISMLLSKMTSIESADWRLMVALSNVYFLNDNKEEAIAWLEKAIELNPDSDQLRNQLIAIRSEDRVQSIIAIVKSKELSETEEATSLAVSLFTIGSELYQESVRWNRVGNGVESASALKLSEKAFEISKEYQLIAEELGGDLSQIIALDFSQAMSEKNIAKANDLVSQFEEASDDVNRALRMRVNLNLLAADIEKHAGNLDTYRTYIDKALEIANNATENVSFSDEAWRTLGTVYSAMGNSTDALNAYEKAYRIAPKQLSNIRSYIGSLVTSGEDIQRLMRVVRLAREQHPTNEQLLAVWLDLEALHGNAENVLRYRQRHYLRNPSDRENAIKLANFYINETPEQKFILNPSGSPVYSLKTWKKMPINTKSNIVRKTKADWASISQKILDQVSVDVDPDVRTCVLHTSTLRDKGQLSEASKVWDRFIDSRIGTEEYEVSVIAAADFLVNSERLIQAELLLKSAREFQGDTFAIDGALGSVFFLQKKFEEAASAFEKTVQITNDRVLHSRMIEALVLSGQFEKAETSLSKLATTNTPYATLMLEAMIHRVKTEQLLAQGDIAGGTASVTHYRDALHRAMEADSSSQVPYFQLCISLLNEYGLTQNKALLEEALQIISAGEKSGLESEQFAVIRADVYQADGQFIRSTDSLAMYVANNPEANNARRRLVEAYLDTGNVDRAISTVEDGIELDPASDIWHQRLGALHVRANDNVSDAIIAYISALERRPTVRILHQINTLARTDKELPNHDLLLMAQSDISKLHPVALTIEAKALQNLGRRRDGLLAMGRSWAEYHSAIENGWIPPLSVSEWFVDLHELFQENPEEGALMALELAGGTFTAEQKFGLAQYYKQFGDEYIDRCLEIISEALDNPNTPESMREKLLTMQGVYLVDAGRLEESKSVYKQLVEERNSPIVMNNYAYVVGVFMDEPEEGLQIAKDAAKQAPREPSIIDTVAVLYDRTGNYEKAAEMFDYLLQIDPSNASAMSKLAILYADKLNQPERGIVFAERARSLSPRAPEVLDALGWSYYKTGRNDKAEDLIQRSLRSEETMDAYIHLAQIVMNKDKYDAALGHLRMAQELAKDPYSKNRISSLQDDIRKIQASVSE